MFQSKLDGSVFRALGLGLRLKGLGRAYHIAHSSAKPGPIKDGSVFRASGLGLRVKGLGRAYIAHASAKPGPFED